MDPGRNVIPIVLAFASAAFFPACDVFTPEWSPDVKSPLPGSPIEFSASYRIIDADQLEFRIRLSNRSSRNAALEFRTGQVYDIEIFDENGNLVWKWSDGRFFTQAVWSMVIPPGTPFSRTESWDMKMQNGSPVPPGRYAAKVTLTWEDNPVRILDLRLDR